jgi:hypothetical protein
MLIPDKITEAHIFAFFFIHFVDVCNDGIEVDELFKIMEKVEGKIKTRSKEDKIDLVVWRTVQDSMNWYMSLDVNKRNKQCVEICDQLKLSLSEDQKLKFLDDLVEIGNAGPKIVKSEKEIIHKTASHWDVQYDLA